MDEAARIEEITPRHRRGGWQKKKEKKRKDGKFVSPFSFRFLPSRNPPAASYPSARFSPFATCRPRSISLSSYLGFPPRGLSSVPLCGAGGN